MMGRQAIIACLIYLSLVLQASGRDGLTYFGMQIWLPGIAFVACHSLTNGTASLVWSGILGFGLDCLGTEQMGMNLAIITLISLGILLVRSGERQPTILLYGLFGFVSTFLWRAAVLAIHCRLDHQLLPLTSILTMAASNGLSVAVVIVTCRTLQFLLRRGFSPRRTSTVSLSNRWSMLTG